MNDIRLINIRKSILSDNEDQAKIIREDLAAKKTFMVNLMASPGAGKTSLILKTIISLREMFRIGVIEGDIESLVDSEKISALGIPAVQIRTGGACHLEAPMVTPALAELDLPNLDLVLIENIGNLVCPAEFDMGEDLKVMILSVPEGDDKILKYPLMFSVSDVLIVNKVDYLDGSDFNLELLKERIRRINPSIQIFEVSCKNGSGIDRWCSWLGEQVGAKVYPSI